VRRTRSRPAASRSRSRGSSSSSGRIASRRPSRRPARHPRSRHAVRQLAHLLLSLGRGDEARGLLVEAARASECAPLVGQLAALLAEQGRFGESLQWLERFEDLARLLDRDEGRWLAALRSQALYGLGDVPGARRQAALAGDPFHAALVERLAEATRDARRVVLDVPFVRQQHNTCTPATLASLSAYWGRPVEQSDLIDAFCYAGTRPRDAWAWAEAHGWAVREFRVTWASACALLDRGIPFLLGEGWSQGGHHQAVVGYDARRGTLLIRCPSGPFLRELDAGPFLKQQEWCGPHGAVVLPEDRAERLSGLELPDARLYGELRGLRDALLGQRREQAEAIRRRLSRTAPEHPLTHEAALAVAEEDRDGPGMLRCLAALEGAFPDAAAPAARRLRFAWAIGQGSQSARRLAAAHPRDTGLQSLWALELSRTSQGRRARRVLRRVLGRANPHTEAINLATLAHLDRDEGRLDEALELDRLAAHVEDRDEGYAWCYFTAAKGRGRSEEALAFLRARLESFGRRSGGPAETLYLALQQCRRRDEGLAALERGIQLRPEDGALALASATAHAQAGRLERADALLSGARGRVRPGDWFRAAADLARRRGDHAESLDCWRQVLVAEPAGLDGHQGVAAQLAATRGRAAALAHAKQACRRFPADQGLRRLRATWERGRRGRSTRVDAPPLWQLRLWALWLLLRSLLQA
jgi:tetratricopeptide (TPR) repeat protein